MPGERQSAPDEPNQHSTAQPPAQQLPIFTSVASPDFKPELQQDLGRLPQVVVQTAFGPAPQRGGDLIAAKITGEHITTAFGMQEKDSERKSNEKKLGMYLGFGALIAVLVFVCVLSLLFLIYSKPEFIEKILIAMISLAAGAAGGFGVGRTTSPKPKG